MNLHVLPLLMMVLLGCACAAPADTAADSAAAPKDLQDSGDLKTDASSYIRRYSDWGGGYPANNYNNYATGYGLLDDKYSTYNGGYNGYSGGYNGYNGYNGGYSGYSGTGYSGYTGNTGYGYKGGYDSSLGYGQGIVGNGGYGGYGGNGGLTSYYGYNNPYYQGSSHVGYGYRKPGYGNIYNSGITPSLVTGYRGYSRR